MLFKHVLLKCFNYPHIKLEGIRVKMVPLNLLRNCFGIIFETFVCDDISSESFADIDDCAKVYK